MWIDSGRDLNGLETRTVLETGAIATYRPEDGERKSYLSIRWPGRNTGTGYHGPDADQLWQHINGFVWRPTTEREQPQ